MALSRPSHPDIFLASLVIHLLALAVPLSLLQIYDRILPSQSYGTTVTLVIGVALAIMLEAILRYSRSVIFARQGARYEATTITRMAEKLFSADINEVEKRGTAWFNDALRAVPQIKDLQSGNAASALYEVPFILVYICLIAYIGGWLALVPLSLFLSALILVLWLQRQTLTTAREVEQRDMQRKNLQWKIFSGLRDIKANAAEDTTSRQYLHTSERYMAANARLEFLSTWLRENSALFGQLSTLLVVSFGAVLVMQGQITTGVLAACTIMAGRSIGPGFAGLGYLARQAQTHEAADKIDAVMMLPDAANPGASSSQDTAPISHPRLALQGPGGNRLVIEPGEAVLLKADDPLRSAELLSLLAGLSRSPDYQADINGQAIPDLHPLALRRTVALVTKEAALVSGTILSNLTLFDPRFNEAAHSLAEQLDLLRFTNTLRSGLLTEVGPLAAQTLSAGLTQRIALIRALVRRPRVLLLDNAGADLDMDGQKRLAALLQQLAGTITIIMVSRSPALQAVCSRTVDLDQELPHD